MNKKIRAAFLAAIGVSATAALLYFASFTNPKQNEKPPEGVTASVEFSADNIVFNENRLHYRVSDSGSTSQKRLRLPDQTNDIKLIIENRSDAAFTVSLTRLSDESLSDEYLAADVKPGSPLEWSPEQSGQKEGLPEGDYILQIRSSGQPIHAEVWGSLANS